MTTLRISRPASPALIAALLLAFAAAPSLDAQPPQSVHRRGFEPVDDARFGILTQFFDLDASVPLEARAVESWDEDAARNEKVVFTTQSGERVPGWLSLPVEEGARVPCVLLLHGLGNSKERWEREDRSPLRERLLAAGIGVLAIDLRYHGERSSTNDYQSPVYLTLGNTLFVRSRDMVIQSTIDARRALAMLRERPEVDPKRLGVVGYSMGSMLSLILGALEPDVAAIVASAVPTTEQPMPIDPFQFAPRVGPPVLLQIGRTDWLSSPEDAERLVGLLPAKGSALRFYDAPHQLPPVFATDAAAWLIGQFR